MYFHIENNCRLSKDLESILNLDSNELFERLGTYQNIMIKELQETVIMDYFNSIKDIVNIECNGNEVLSITFYNVWNRSNIIITSSL